MTTPAPERDGNSLWTSCGEPVKKNGENVQPDPDFSYNMFEHGLTELFVGAGGPQGQGGSMQGDDLQQVLAHSTEIVLAAWFCWLGGTLLDL